MLTGVLNDDPASTGQFGNTCAAAKPTKARDPAKGHPGCITDRRAAHVDNTAFDLIGHSKRAADVSAEHRSRQALFGIIRRPHSFALASDTEDRLHRARACDGFSCRA